MPPRIPFKGGEIKGRWKSNNSRRNVLMNQWASGEDKFFNYTDNGSILDKASLSISPPQRNESPRSQLQNFTLNKPRKLVLISPTRLKTLQIGWRDFSVNPCKIKYNVISPHCQHKQPVNNRQFAEKHNEGCITFPISIRRPNAGNINMAPLMAWPQPVSTQSGLHLHGKCWQA